MQMSRSGDQDGGSVLMDKELLSPADQNVRIALGTGSAPCVFLYYVVYVLLYIAVAILAMGAA